MILRRAERPSYQKPPLGCAVDWAHPLAQGLIHAVVFNESAGLLVTDLMARPERGSLRAAAQWAARANGLGVAFDGTASTDITFGSGGLVHPNRDISVYQMVIPTSFAGSATLGSIAGAALDSYHWAVDTWVLSNIVGIGSGIAFTAGNLVGVGFGYKRAVEARFSAMDYAARSLKTSTVANASTPTQVAGQPSTIGSKWGQNGTTGTIFLTYIWARQLSFAEFAQLHAEPYAFLVERVRPVSFFFPRFTVSGAITAHDEFGTIPGAEDEGGLIPTVVGESGRSGSGG